MDKLTARHFLHQIKKTRVEYADQALSNRSSQTLLEIGQMQGIYQGLKIAEELFLKSIGEPDDRNSD